MLNKSFIYPLIGTFILLLILVVLSIATDKADENLLYASAAVLFWLYPIRLLYMFGPVEGDNPDACQSRRSWLKAHRAERLLFDLMASQWLILPVYIYVQYFCYGCLSWDALGVFGVSFLIIVLIRDLLLYRRYRRIKKDSCQK